MCDTFVICPKYSKNGKMIFAKNSDRSPNEAHVFSHIERKVYSSPCNVKCTYISIPQASTTYAVTLFKPDWIWGAEMGYNEHNLFIGNEAVFTNQGYGKENDGLIGMDLLRLALERAKTPMEAIYVITTLIKTYSQNGNCGYDHDFRYHNSFLIANDVEAYHLETAGEYYCYKKVDGVYAISNRLSIDKDYDFVCQEAIEYAIASKKIKSYGDFSFCKVFSEPIFTFFSGSKKRQSLITQYLNGEKEKNIRSAINALRLHSFDSDKVKASLTSPCMHYGTIVGDHTTGSMVAEISSNGNHIVFATLSSTPCVSMFKPILDNSVVDKDDKYYWVKREFLNRSFFSKESRLSDFKPLCNKLENEYLDIVESEDMNNWELRKKITEEAFKEENELVSTYLKDLPEKLHFCGNPLYNYLWSKKTEALLK